MSIPPICLGNNTNLPNNIDIQSPFIFQTYKVHGENEGKTDFMVLAEFSEIEGPVPILIIPNNIKPFIEINELVMNLMSTDYQCRGSNEFRIWNSTSLTFLNHGVGQFICAQYFILYDIRARGFVRPMCIAYCSTSLQKILTYEAKLEEEICQAIEYLKICNLHMFKNELDSRIQDLLYTKKRLLLSERNAKQKKVTSATDADVVTSISVSQSTSSDHAKMCDNRHGLYEPEQALTSSFGSYDSVRLASIMFVDSNEEIDDNDEESVLQHVSLDALATQITDCQHIFKIVTDYLQSSSMQSDLEDLEKRISVAECPLQRFIKIEETASQSKCYSPSVFVWSLVKRNYRNMRKIKELCGVGYLACLLKLLNVFETYSKPFTDLFFRDLEFQYGFFHRSVGTPQIGIVSCESKLVKLPKFSFSDVLYDGKLVQILTTLDKNAHGSRDFIESYNSDVNDNITTDLVNVMESNISLQHVQNVVEPTQAYLHNYKYISFRLETNWRILLDDFGEAIKSILYSILCGKTVVVAGPEAMEEKVAEIIDILSSILPYTRENNFPVFRWHMGIVTKYHLDSYRIIGVCIPERLHLHELMSNDTLNKVTVLNVSTNRISGVAYSGKYLETSNLFSKRNKVEYDKSMINSCFQTLIQNTLSRLGRDAILLTHLLDATTRSDDQILKGLGILQGDWASVKYIYSLLRTT